MLERFSAAIGTGEILRIVYDGGSSPGSVRDILALAILPDGKVRAKCLTTGQAKTFILEKMRLRENAEETYVPGALKLPHYASLSDVFADMSPGIKALGWHIQLEDGDDGSQCLSAHRVTKKTGKPLKGSFASLTYSRIQWDSIVTPDGRFERANVRPSVRPYAVRSKFANSTPTFKELDNAVVRFLEAVKAMPLER
ncbi:MAG: hypothetical protein J0G33_07045 [Afipia felis]|nr:hypothetical protein [Afipia felis]